MDPMLVQFSKFDIFMPKALLRIRHVLGSVYNVDRHVVQISTACIFLRPMNLEILSSSEWCKREFVIAVDK